MKTAEEYLEELKWYLPDVPTLHQALALIHQVQHDKEQETIERCAKICKDRIVEVGENPDDYDLQFNEICDSCSVKILALKTEKEQSE